MRKEFAFGLSLTIEDLDLRSYDHERGPSNSPCSICRCGETNGRPSVTAYRFESSVIRSYGDARADFSNLRNLRGLWLCSNTRAVGPPSLFP